MAMKSPEEYRESLRDGRELYMDGARIPDITADSYGGWEQVTTLQAGGGLTAQKFVSYRTYDLGGAKQLAREAVGIANGIPQQAAATAGRA